MPDLILMNAKRIFTFGMLTLAHSASLSELAEGALVMDQIGEVGAYDFGARASPSSSQVFTDLVGFECMAIDDFTVDAAALKITEVSALVWARNGFASFQEVVGYQLSIFSSSAMAAATLTGDAGSLLVVDGSGASVTPVGGNHGLVSLRVDLTLLAAGTYWVGIAPVAADYLAGQFYVQNSGARGTRTPGNGNGAFANPKEGFEIGALTNTTLDYAYAVTVVPEPATAMLWLLGTCVWLGRRRRARLADENW